MTLNSYKSMLLHIDSSGSHKYKILQLEVLIINLDFCIISLVCF